MVQVNLTGPDYREAVNTQDEFLVKDLEQDYKDSLDTISTIGKVVSATGAIIDKGAEGHLQKALLGPDGEFLGKEGIAEQGQAAGSDLDDVDKDGVPLKPNLVPAAKKFDEDYENLVKQAPFFYRAAMRGNKGELKAKYMALVEEEATNERDYALSRMQSDEGTPEDEARILRAKSSGIRNRSVRAPAVDLQSLQYVKARLNEDDPIVARSGVVDAYIGAANQISKDTMSQPAMDDANKYAEGRAEKFASSPSGRAKMVSTILDKPSTAKSSTDETLAAYRLYASYLAGSAEKWAQEIVALVPALEAYVSGVYTRGDASIIVRNMLTDITRAAREIRPDIITKIVSKAFGEHNQVDVPGAFTRTLKDLSLTLGRMYRETPDGKDKDRLKKTVEVLNELRNRVVPPATTGGRGAGGGGGGGASIVPSRIEIYNAGGVLAAMRGKSLPANIDFTHLERELTAMTPFTQRLVVSSIEAGFEGPFTQADLQNRLADIDAALGDGGRILMGPESPGQLLVLSENDDGNWDDFIGGGTWSIQEPDGNRPATASRVKTQAGPPTRAQGTTTQPQGGALQNASGEPKPGVFETNFASLPFFEAVRQFGLAESVESEANFLAGTGMSLQQHTPEYIAEMEEFVQERAVALMEAARAEDRELGTVDWLHVYAGGVILGQAARYGAKDGRLIRAINTFVGTGQEGTFLKNGLSRLDWLVRNPTPGAVKEFLTNTPLGKKVAAELGEDAMAALSVRARASGTVGVEDAQKRVNLLIKKIIRKEVWKSIRGGVLKNVNPLTGLRNTKDVVFTLARAVGAAFKSPAGKWSGSQAFGKLIKKTGKELLYHLKNPRTILTGMRRFVSIPWIAAEQAILQPIAFPIERGRESLIARNTAEMIKRGELTDEEIKIQAAQRNAPGAFSPYVPLPNRQTSDRQALTRAMYLESFTSEGVDLPIVGEVSTDYMESPYVEPKGYDEHAAEIAGRMISLVTTGSTNPRGDLIKEADGYAMDIDGGSVWSMSPELHMALYPNGVKNDFNENLHESQAAILAVGVRLDLPLPEYDHTKPPGSAISPRPRGVRIYGTDMEYLEDHKYMLFETADQWEDYGVRLLDHVWDNPGDREAAVLMEAYSSDVRGGRQQLLWLIELFPSSGKNLAEVFSIENLTAEGVKAIDNALTSKHVFGLQLSPVARHKFFEDMVSAGQWDRLADFLEPIMADPAAHTFFKSLLPPMPPEDAMVTISALSILGDGTVAYEMRPNDRLNHFIAYHTLRRMNEEQTNPGQSQFLAGGGGRLGVPLDPVERAAHMSALWIEFDLKALLDGPPGWIDLDEWDRLAVQVGNNAEKWYGPQFSNLNKSLKMPPGQSIRDSVNPTVVSERLSAKQEELRSVELTALGPLQDVLHGVLAGIDKYQVAYDALGSTGETGMGFNIGTDSPWALLNPMNLFRGEGSIHLTKGDVLTPEARVRANEMLLRDQIESWSSMVTAIETNAAVPEHYRAKGWTTEIKLMSPKKSRAFTREQLVDESFILFKTEGKDQWIPLESLRRGLEIMRRYENNYYMIKELDTY